MNESTNSFDLQIGIQQIKYETPSNFRYTKFCAIKPGKLFQSSFFQMTNLIAAGTLEGPILIYTENFETLSHVCILCAHTAPVTDIIQTENNYFVSASKNGTIVKWSNDDCSYISSFRHIAEKGEILLSLYPPNPHFIMINTVGFSTFLFDLETGMKIRTFDIFGITQVSFLHPDKCFSIASPSLAILKFNLFTLYSESDIISLSNNHIEPISKYAINIGEHQSYFLSEYGLIRTKNRDWELLSPFTMSKLLSGKVKKRISHDFISNVKWSNPTTFCISTYGSRFVIYNIEIVKNNDFTEPRLVNAIPVTSPIETVCNHFLFFSINLSQTDQLMAKKKAKINKAQSATSIEFNNNRTDQNPQAISLQSFNQGPMNDCRIVLTPKPRKILSLKIDGTFSMNFFNRYPRLYHVPRVSSARVVETNGGKVFYISNWEKGGHSTLKHICNRRITSLLSRESQRLKLEVIAGCSDGTVSFFSENTSKPFHTEIVLSSPVIGLVHLPLKYRGRLTMLVIGNDGSAALLKNNKVVMHYANFMMKLVAAYYHEVDQCLIFKRIDESFIVFKIDEPGPVLLTSSLPKGSTLVWSLNEMQNETGVYNENFYTNVDYITVKHGLKLNSDSALKTNNVRFGRNSWFYSSVGISNFINVHNRRYKLFAKFINQLFQQKSDGFFPHSQSLTFASSLNDHSNIEMSDNSDLDDSEDEMITSTSSSTFSSKTSSSSGVVHFDLSNVKPAMKKKKRFDFSKESTFSKHLNNNLNPLSTSEPSFKPLIPKPLTKQVTVKKMLPKPLTAQKPPPVVSSPPASAPNDDFGQFPKSQSIQSLVNWISPQKPSFKLKQSPNVYQKIIDSLSLVIVGESKKTATFFFPEYRICGNMAFILSDKNSVKNMIIKTLISGETSDEQHPELILPFGNLLSCGNYNIEMAASIECNRLIDCVTPEIASNLMHSIPLNSSSKSHLFITSIVAFTHPNLVPRKKYQELLSFLVMMTMSQHGSSSLALSILIRGFEFWSNVNSNSKVNLFSKLIDCFIRVERPKALEDIFFSAAIDNLEDFFEAMKNEISTSFYSKSSQKVLKKFIDLMSKVAFSDPQKCGTQIALSLVNIASEFEALQSLIADEIGTYSIFFTSVAILNNFIVIGSKNGYISVFKNFKLVIYERAFASMIDYVSIGPNAQFCAAISVSVAKAIIFALPAPGILNSFHKRSGIETSLEKVGGHYKIYWSDPAHCHFSVAD
ncbi:hypothetical protein M9Y10_012500 [Tritrichomonas musculus]|uniref:Uncharacterized protein n=1 Tax=Tritrichomonas musculus TaxID=1915356 RepID=A0ABR2IDZ8_9EUKA